MEGIVIGLVALAVFGGLVVWVKWNRQVVECVNCRDRMTRARHRKNGGCVRCGSDLIRRSGRVR